MKKDNRGLSLVELIISIAMTSLIVLTATILISSALKNYNFASATISMQSQAQVLMEQIGKWTMEGNRLETGTMSDGSYLIIWDIPMSNTEKVDTSGTATASTASNRVIWYSSTNGELYMTTNDGIDVGDVDGWSKSPTFGSTLSGYMGSDVKENYLIGDKITSATIEYTKDADGNDTDNAVAVSLKFETGSQTYELSNEFKVRNIIVMEEDILPTVA